MTAVPDSERRTRYAPVVATARFNVGFVIFGASDLNVYINGIQREKADATYPWSVDATFVAGECADGQVVAAGSGWSGVTVDIVGAAVPSRTDQFGDGVGIPGASFNLILNRVMAILRESYDQRTRALRVAFGGTLTGLIPDAATRAGQALVFDVDGNPGVGDLMGEAGAKGWTPVLAVVSDSARRVLQVTDWTGGEGAKPATGSYIGSSGLVTLIASAVDIRGAQGTSGAGTGDMLAANNLSDVSSASTARTNLGLGTMATKSAVATADITDLNVTTGKLALLAVTAAQIAAATITGAKLAANTVANSLLGTVAAFTFKGRKTGTTGDPEDFAITDLTEKTTLVGNDLVVISDSEASGALKKAKKSNFASAGSFTEASNQQPTTNVSTISATGLSAYKLVKIHGAIGLNSAADLQLRARVGSGTWRSIGAIAPVTGLSYAGGTVVLFDIEIANFNTAHEKIVSVAYMAGTDGQVLDDSNAANLIAANSFYNGAGMAMPSWPEIWDEIELSPSAGTFQGVTSDQRGRVLIYGMA